MSDSAQRMFGRLKSKGRFAARSAVKFIDRSVVKTLLRHHLERERVASNLAVSRVEHEKAQLTEEVERLKRDLAAADDEVASMRGQALRLQAMRKTADEYKTSPGRNDRIKSQICEVLQHGGISKGSMLEIGGRRNSLRSSFPEFEYTNLDLVETGPGVLKADITSCPEISSGQFDVIVSIDVFEHIDRPWLAASEICRLLKPGGVTYHSTLFSWRYHPCPIDYWRFSPDALVFLFSDLQEIGSGFDAVERRRNNLGKGKHLVPQDSLGGWRENWRVFFAGLKSGV